MDSHSGGGMKRGSLKEGKSLREKEFETDHLRGREFERGTVLEKESLRERSERKREREKEREREKRERRERERHTHLVQRCALHQLKGGRVNLAVVEVDLLVKLFLLPLCDLHPG